MSYRQEGKFVNCYGIVESLEKHSCAKRSLKCKIYIFAKFGSWDQDYIFTSCNVFNETLLNPNSKAILYALHFLQKVLISFHLLRKTVIANRSVILSTQIGLLSCIV